MKNLTVAAMAIRVFVAFLVSLPGLCSVDAAGLVLLPTVTIADAIAEAGSDEADPGRPAVGFDGTNYMVVSRRSFGETQGLFGVVVSPAGAVLKSFQIGGRMLWWEHAYPSLAFDGTNFLVAFSVQAEVYYIRVSPTGEVLDSAEGVHVGSGSYPSVSFDGQNYLVVFLRYHNPYSNIHGIRISPAGQLLDDFTIDGSPGNKSSPAVVFDGSNHLAVWEKENGTWPDIDTDILGARVSPAGTVLDTNLLSICSFTNYQGSPHLAFDGTNSLVVWRDQRNYIDGSYYWYDIYGTRVSTNGVVLDTNGIAINTRKVEYRNDPRVCFDGRNFVVVWWNAQYSDDGGIFAARVSPAGKLLDGPAHGIGIKVKGATCYSCKTVHGVPISNGRTVMLAGIHNAELGGTYKSAFARLLIDTSHTGQLLWQHTNGTVMTWYMERNRYHASHVIASRPPEWKVVSQPDLNSDGEKDLLWQHSDGRLSVWYMNGTKRISAAMLPASGRQWPAVGTADFNGDHAPDIVFKNANGTARVWFMDGTNVLSQSLLADGKIGGPEWKLNLVADIDEDGDPDLLWQKPDNTVVAWIMDGMAFSHLTPIRKATDGWILNGFADINRDGHQDLVFQHVSKRSAAWFMNGTNFLSSTTLATGNSPGSAWRMVGPK